MQSNLSRGSIANAGCGILSNILTLGLGTNAIQVLGASGACEVIIQAIDRSNKFQTLFLFC
jgi:hypothetical protein